MYPRLQLAKDLLSPDGAYLSCIAKGHETDTAYVWDLDDLYWFKYKFSCSRTKIDCVAFTPDSKSILVIYKKSNPVLYNLVNGKKMLELEKKIVISKYCRIYCKG